MVTLTITAKGQVTLHRELLRPALWEFVWVLRRVCTFPVAEISAAIRALMEAGNVSLDRAAVEAGLSPLEGGDTFLSFDPRAVALLQQRGIAAALLT